MSGMSFIWKFWTVSGMFFWLVILVCIVAFVSYLLVDWRKFAKAVFGKEKEYERCTLCEGERWLWRKVDGTKSSARERVPCPDCQGTGRTEVRRK